MAQTNPLLSAILVVGPLRNRAQKSLTALCHQTAKDKIEIVVIDLAPADTPALQCDSKSTVHYYRRPDLKLWSQARYFGLMESKGPIVASIEDHAFARPEWAEALIEAHKGPWAAVGYAFVNANPATFRSRSCMLKDYGPWMHPTPGGQTGFVPGHNISYRRDVLLSFGAELEELYSLDFTMQDAIRGRGLPMYVEPRAIVAHENFASIRQMIGVHIAYQRLLAARRMKVQHWSMGRRLLYAILTPLGAPTIATYRYLRSFARRPSLWIPALLAMPIFLLTHAIAGSAEATSYLFGGGGAEYEVMSRWELMTVRTLAG